MRTVRLFVVLTVSALTATTATRAQQLSATEQGMTKPWDFTVDQDKFTHKKVLTARATVASSETPSHIYRLTFECDGDSREITLGTFDTTDAANVMMVPRPLPGLQTSEATVISIQYRVDSGTPSSVSAFSAQSDSANVVVLASGIFGAKEGLPGGTFSETATLPRNRLVISDLFHDETVEFPFATLTSDSRAALEKMCGFVDPTLAPEGTVAPKQVPSSSESQPILVTSASGDVAYKGGNGIIEPEVIREVKPNYTRDAMRAKIEGTVDLQALVMTDGSIQASSLTITRSLDPRFGLDEEAKKAVRQWRFRPGICNRPEGCGGVSQGKPVPVLIVVELTFTLRR